MITVSVIKELNDFMNAFNAFINDLRTKRSIKKINVNFLLQ